MAKLVSKTYGDALFELATEENKEDVLLEEAEGLKKLISENDEFLKMMNHPQITRMLRRYMPMSIRSTGAILHQPMIIIRQIWIS